METPARVGGAARLHPEVLHTVWPRRWLAGGFPCEGFWRGGCWPRYVAVLRQAMVPPTLCGWRALGHSVEGGTSVRGVFPTCHVTSQVPPLPGSLPWSPWLGRAPPMLLAQHRWGAVICLWVASVPGGWGQCVGPDSIQGSAQVWELVVDREDGQGAQGCWWEGGRERMRGPASLPWEDTHG